MKRILILCLVLGFILSCEQLSRDTAFIELKGINKAQSEVEAILSMLPNGLTKSTGRRTVSERWTGSSGTKTSSLSEPDSLYFFNFADSLGYAVVSSDERIGLLALVLEGSIGPETKLSNLGQIIMLENIAQSIKAAADSLDDPPVPEIVTVYGEWTNTFYAPTTGYCSAKWGNNDPYNYYHPTINGQKAAACCVAVATGQLMSMYQYPSSYNGQLYYWGMMVINPYYSSGDGVIHVPRLLSDLSSYINLNVQYGFPESFSELSFVPRTLSQFGYYSGGYMDDYDSATIISELKNGYPLLLGGKSYEVYLIQTLFGIQIDSDFVGYDGGHVWLVHGLLERQRPVYTYTDGILTHTYYQQADYLLCNFGWDPYGLNIGTSADGYYVAGLFNTNNGPVFNSSTILTKDSHYEYVGEEGYYCHELKMLTGIRKQQSL